MRLLGAIILIMHCEIYCAPTENNGISIEYVGKNQDSSREEFPNIPTSILNTPRSVGTFSFCGTRDNTLMSTHRGHRKKRFVLASSWNKLHITWRFKNSNSKFYHDSDKIRQRIAEALQMWKDHSVLTFEERSESHEKVDIEVQLLPPSHRNIDSFTMDGDALAHAFFPSDGHLAGGVHVRDDLNWDFDANFERFAEKEKKSFFGMVLHELGHSLGLNHSNDIEAVMFPTYGEKFTLHEDDIRGIQRMYGQPEGYRFTTKKPLVRINHELPNKCHMKYDAIMNYNGELFIFRGKYFFRPGIRDNREVEITGFWRGFPKGLTHVDAAYKNADGKVLFFIGQRVFIFVNMRLESEQPLTNFGIDENVNKIDAIFMLDHNKFTYILSGRKFWRFDEENYKVQPGYPKTLDAYFKGVYGIDTAVAYNQRLYFFRKEHFYEFDTKIMSMAHAKPRLSANKFMGCGIAEYPPAGGNNGRTAPRRNEAFKEARSSLIEDDYSWDEDLPDPSGQSDVKVSKCVLASLVIIMLSGIIR